jgi:sortase A
MSPETPPPSVHVWLSRALLACGVGCLGYVVYVSLDARWFDWIQGRRFAQAAAAHRQAGSSGATRDGAAETDRFDGLRPLPTGPAPDEGAVLGRIEIPRHDVSALLLEGVEPLTLRHGAGHIPGTAGLEQPGNIGIAAHRDSFFRGLKDVAKGDTVRLTTLDGVYDYRVDWTRIVGPDDVEVLAPSGDPELTLVTCYPFYYVGAAPQRFIVRAHRVPVIAGS